MNSSKKKVAGILFNLLLWLLFVVFSFLQIKKYLLLNRYLDIILNMALIFLAGLILIPSQYDRAVWLIKAKKIAIIIFSLVGVVYICYALWWPSFIYLFLAFYTEIDTWPENKDG